jgi:hypothetical protein
MSIVNVLSVEVRPDKFRKYERLCHELAEHAKNRHDPMHWTAHQTRIGPSNAMHFVLAAEDFSALSAMGTPEEMFGRVLGEERAREWVEKVDDCVVIQQQEISVDRPDLSYPPDDLTRTTPLAVVTLARARPGQQDACEELIRKVAEAIPKVDDAARIISYQTILGDLSQYWTIRPLESLAELDRQLPPAELLNQAFGPAEGGLIFRSGLDAMAGVERRIVAYRPELSNPTEGAA